jgi:predicted transcriptional regulator
MAGEANLTELTAVIVGSFVSNNSLKAADVPALISSTHAALARIDAARSPVEASRTPAVPIEDSITHDYLVCLNDGQKFKSLKRYLQRKYSLSPEQYRKKWCLPPDYPMVAPAYTKLRSEIAKRKAAVRSGPSRSSRQPKS